MVIKSVLYSFNRFASYDHLIRFWEFIEPAVKYMIRSTRSTTGLSSRPVVCLVLHELLQCYELLFCCANPYSMSLLCFSQGQALHPIDELFLFLSFLALGEKQKALGVRFQVSQSTVSRIILTWSNFLLSTLGSLKIWQSQEKIKEYLPEDFRNYPDTSVILDCTEFRCQTPSSPLTQSEVYSQYKSYCTLKGMIGIAPHGAVTFISPLFAGSISDKQLFMQSGICQFLNADSAIMVDRGFLIDNVVPCKVYRPAFLSGREQMPENEMVKSQEIAQLRVHVERVIRRLKEHQFFHYDIPLNMFGNVNQLFMVACLLLNYENQPLVKAWAK